MKYIDNVPNWRRGSRIFECTRIHTMKVDWQQMQAVLPKVSGPDAGTFVSGKDGVQSLGSTEGDMFQAKSE